MITRVELKNWKSHRRTELELGEGTNALVGIMGSGKSAVLDAITYGLFGTIPAVQDRRISLDDLIRKRPVQEDSAEVEVEFTTPEGEGYVVKRVLERGEGTTLAELRSEDGTLINKPKSTAVTEDVTSLLQIDYDFFERMIYAEQNQLDRFLRLEPRKRRKKVDELLKINKFEKARKNTSTLINRLKEREKGRRKDIEELREDEEIEALPSLESELEEAEAEKEELEEKKKGIKPKLEKVKSKLEKLKQIESDIEEISKNIESIKGQIETLNKQISKSKERLGDDLKVSLEKINQRKKELDEKLQKKRERVEELETEAHSKTVEVSELKAERKSLEEKISDLKDEIKKKKKSKERLDEINLPEIKEGLEELEEERVSLKEKFADHKAQIKNLKKSLGDLRKAESACPVCERPLTEKVKADLIQDQEKKLENYQAQATDLENKIGEVEEAISQKTEFKEEAKNLEKEVEDLPDLKSELTQIKGELEQKSQSLEDSLEKEEKVSKKLDKAKREVEETRKEYEDVKDKVEFRKDLESAKKEKQEIKQKENEFRKKLQKKKEEYDEEEAERLKEKQGDLIKRQEHFKTRLSEMEKLIEERKKLVESVRKKKRTLERRKTEAEVLRDSISSLNKFQKALSKSQTSLRKQVIKAVNGMMNDIWDEIYPYEDFDQIRLSIEERRKISDYELQVMDSSGTWVSVEGITSGGERTCASLTLRIAFAAVLSPSLSWLVLDEPTHNLDPEGIDKLSEVLRERAPKIMQQLLLITHEKRLESAVSGYLYRFSRDKSRDGPTQVEKVREAK